MNLAPDAARYWLAAQGNRVARPFNLRWLLPLVCRTDLRRWWAVWGCSWVALGGGTLWLGWGLGWQRALFATIVCVTLPGLRVPAVKPIGVDVPAMGFAVLAAATATHGVWWLAVPLVVVGAGIKESAPVWAALWAWNPILLVGLFAVAVAAIVRPSEIDRFTAHPHLLEVHEHPVKSSLEYRRGRYRDAYLWVWPLGACLAALWSPTQQTLVVLLVAHLQLVVATDTVRLVASCAGPALAVAAAAVIPVPALWLVAVAHVFWWRPPEVI